VKHNLKITLFVVLDTEHSDYDGPEDADAAAALIEQRLEESAPPELEYGLSLQALHAEVVE